MPSGFKVTKLKATGIILCILLLDICYSSKTLIKFKLIKLKNIILHNSMPCYLCSRSVISQATQVQWNLAGVPLGRALNPNERRLISSRILLLKHVDKIENEQFNFHTAAAFVNVSTTCKNKTYDIYTSVDNTDIMIPVIRIWSIDSSESVQY